VLETLKDGSIFSDIVQEHWRLSLLQYDIVSFRGTLDEVSTIRCSVGFEISTHCTTS